jgi:hypothetical protein
MMPLSSTFVERRSQERTERPDHEQGERRQRPFVIGNRADRENGTSEDA